MIPQITKFTGLAINPRELLYPFGGRKQHCPPPPSWVRVDFNLEYRQQFSNRLISDSVDLWISKHMTGRWSSYTSQASNIYMVVYFELEDDAILFKLMGGDKAALDSTLN